MNLACAAGIGAVSGLRSMAGPAIVSEAASHNRVRVGKTPLAWLASDSAATTSALLAVGELIADKLPFIPNRTEPASLALRAASGALCGYAICVKQGPGKRAWMAAAVGAMAAVAAAYAGFEYRRRVKLPPIVAALVEDAVAIGAGSIVISAIGR
jgi:uncharacterized membrane protein